MALLVIKDEWGRSHLIHSSQIAPSPRKARVTGWWDAVWARFDWEKTS